MRRGTFTDETVDYAAVGATQSADLMQYPPERSIPFEDSIRIGSGEERFVAAGESLLTWAAQRGAGLTLTDIRPASGPMYSGVSFDDEGNPIAPARSEAEQRFDADGTPFVSPGTTVRVRGRINSANVDGLLRVITVIEGARRVGFALGTVGESVVSGEELFLLEWRSNDEVWFTVRAFDAPAKTSYRIFPVLLRRRRRALATKYIQAMSPMFATP